MNRHCFILGNGPSLLEEDLSLLKDEDIFVCNRGYKIRDLGLDFKYYVLADRKHALEFHKEIDEQTIKSKRYFSSQLNKQNTIKLFRNDYTIFKRSATTLDKIPLSFDNGWGKTRNVITDAIIIAYLLDYKKIFLLGVDLDYSKEHNHFYKESEFESFYKFKVPDNIQVILNSLKFTVDELAKKNIKVINLSKNFKYTEYIPTGNLGDIKWQKITDGKEN